MHKIIRNYAFIKCSPKCSVHVIYVSVWYLNVTISHKEKQASEQIIQIRKRSNGRVNEKSHSMMVTHGQQTCVSSSVYLDVLTQAQSSRQLFAQAIVIQVDCGNSAIGDMLQQALFSCITAFWQTFSFFPSSFYGCLFAQSQYLNFNGLKEWPLL